MLTKLKILYDLPPKASVRLIKRKLFGAQSLKCDDLAGDPKLMRTQRMYDFLSRYEAILQRSIGWKPLEWQGKSVCEIGCGPMFGFLPMAVFLGARHCMGVEPEIVSGVLDNDRLRQFYFKPLHNDLSAIYGERMDFESFMRALQERMVIKNVEILALESGGQAFDIVLSNSCLEHVSPLDKSLAHLAGLCAPDCRFIHSVDFSNHRDKANPFGGIYTRTPEAYFRKYGRGVNLHRASDVLRLLGEAGFDACMTPYAVVPEHLPEKPAKHWTERYETTDMATRVALFSSKGERAPREAAG